MHFGIIMSREISFTYILKGMITMKKKVRSLVMSSLMFAAMAESANVNAADEQTDTVPDLQVREAYSFDDPYDMTDVNIKGNFDRMKRA